MNALFQAIIDGDFTYVQTELERVWYGTVDENGLTGLHYAALYGQPEIGQLFIDKGLFVNRTTYDGKQSLHLAAQAHQDSMVDMLMENGAAILAVDYEGNTPLHYAVRNQPDPAFVQKLIDLGSDLSTENNNGTTALEFIEFDDNSELIVLFLNNGVVSETLSPLLQAVVDADINEVQAQLESAWYGTTDKVGLTGLHYASALGLPEIGQLFIDAGLFVNRTTYDGKQSLHIAAMNHQADMVDFLLDNGAAILAVDYLGNTPLHYAVKGDADLAFVQKLIDYGSDVSTTNLNGETALDLAQQAGNSAIVDLLLNLGGDPEHDTSDVLISSNDVESSTSTPDQPTLTEEDIFQMNMDDLFSSVSMGAREDSRGNDHVFASLPSLDDMLPNILPVTDIE